MSSAHSHWTQARTIGEPEGFRVPIHTALTLPHLLMGIPRGVCLVNWTTVVALSLPLRTWYAIPLGMFFHALAYGAARRDAQVWEVFRRTLKTQPWYGL